jgi:hypothetical protein
MNLSASTFMVPWGGVAKRMIESFYLRRTQQFGWTRNVLMQQIAVSALADERIPANKENVSESDTCPGRVGNRVFSGLDGARASVTITLAGAKLGKGITSTVRTACNSCCWYSSVGRNFAMEG